METKINTEAKKEIILILFSIFLISFVCAFVPPPLPDHFIGNVSIDGQNAPIGTQISIYVDSTLESVYGVFEAGKYDLFVTTGDIDNVIEFKIQDVLAGSATRGWGETVYLDLSITTTLPSPPSPPSGGGGGGGSSGGGSSGGGGGIISPPPINDPGSEENTTQTPEEEQEETSPGITGAVIGFLGSGKGIITIIVVIVLGIGVVLIKSKTPKWKRKSS